MTIQVTDSIKGPYPLATALKTRPFAGIAVLLFVALLSCLTIYRLSAPSAVAASAPPVEFASGRAMKHIQTIGRNPHPMGSAEHAAVQNYLVAELTALGVTPEVQKATVVSKYGGNPVIAGSVENIIARLPGSANTKAVMLTGHYDSVPTGPGASDDGAAVAAMLETLRALKAGPPLKNDVIFLFTDGEENGLLGAQAFVNEHPFKQDIGLVFNFEARGSSGQSLMYETSDNNRWLIEEFAKAAPRPSANSLMYEVYRLLPNDTDLSVFKQAGLPGLNFVYMDQSPNYHTRLDNAETIAEGSLQHQGSYALALTRHFGELDLRTTANGNAVYFDVLGAFLVRYPASWVLPFTLLLLLLLITGIVLGYRRQRLTLKGMALGFTVLLLSMVCAGAVVSLIWRLASSVYNEYSAMTFGDTYNSKLYLVAFVALTLAITSALYLWLGKRTGVLNLWAGALIWWMIFLVLTTLYLPGGSYLFAWALLFNLLSLLFVLFRKHEESRSWTLPVVLMVAAIPAIILFIPVIQILFVGLTVAASAQVMVVVAVLFGALISQLSVITRINKQMPLAALVVCVGFLIAAILTSHFDASRPKQNDLFYALRAETGQAVWASNSDRTDEWTSQFFSTKASMMGLPDFFPGRPWRFLTGEATPVALPAPQIELLADNNSDAGRTLHVRITSPRQAPVISLYVDADAEVLGTDVNGKPVTQAVAGSKRPQPNTWSLRYYALPAEGIELSIVSKSGQPIKIKAVDQSYQLPDIANTNFKPRPDSMMPAPLPLSDSTLVSKSFVF